MYEEEYYESDLELDIDLSEDYENIPEELQRTEKWQEDRLGKITGSKAKLIMSCSPRGSKMSWADKEKVFEFGKSIVPYIYACAMERKTGRYIEMASTSAMKYGTAIEPLIARRIQENYLDQHGLKGREVGFKQFDDIPTAGASSDMVAENEKQVVKATLEFKGCANWTTHYKRTYEKTDDSSIDFWQMITQMCAHNVDKAIYGVISPPKNIMLYIQAENIMDLYEHWCEETTIEIEEVKASEIHIAALKHRIVIVESCIQKYIATGRRIDSILEEEINFHKKKYLEQVIPMTEEEELESENDFSIAASGTVEPKQIVEENHFKEDLFEDSPF